MAPTGANARRRTKWSQGRREHQSSAQIRPKSNEVKIWSKTVFFARSFLGSRSAGLPSQSTQYFLKPGRDLKYLIDILFRIQSTQKWSFFFSNGRWPPLGQMHEDTPNGLEDGVSTNPPHKIRPKSNEVKIWSKQIGSKLKREGRGEEKRHTEMKKWPPLGQMHEDPPKIGSKLKREGRGEEKRHTEMKNGPHWGKCAKTHQMVSRTAWAPILRTNPSRIKWSKNLIENSFFFFSKRSFSGSLSAGLPSQSTQYFLKPGRDLKYLIDILFRI